MSRDDPSDELYGTREHRRFIDLALTQRELTRRQLADALGRSSAWVSMMLSGERPMDPELVEPLCRFLDLNEDLSAYLEALVDLNNRSARSRRTAEATVEARLRHQSAGPGFRDDLVEVYARWYVVAILVLAECEGFRPDPAWIASTLNPPISVEEAQEALELLLRLGALVPDGSGSLIPQQPEQWSPSDIGRGELAEAIAEAQRAHLANAAEALMRFRFNERRMTVLTVGVSEEGYQRVAARLAEIERELVVLASEASATPNRVYLLGIQLFPLSDYTDTEPPP